MPIPAPSHSAGTVRILPSEIFLAGPAAPATPTSPPALQTFVCNTRTGILAAPVFARSSVHPLPHPSPPRALPELLPAPALADRLGSCQKALASPSLSRYPSSGSCRSSTPPPGRSVGSSEHHDPSLFYPDLCRIHFAELLKHSPLRSIGSLGRPRRSGSAIRSR